MCVRVCVSFVFILRKRRENLLYFILCVFSFVNKDIYVHTYRNNSTSSYSICLLLMDPIFQRKFLQWREIYMFFFCFASLKLFLFPLVPPHIFFFCSFVTKNKYLKNNKREAKKKKYWQFMDVLCLEEEDGKGKEWKRGDGLNSISTSKSSCLENSHCRCYLLLYYGHIDVDRTLRLGSQNPQGSGCIVKKEDSFFFISTWLHAYLPNWLSVSLSPSVIFFILTLNPEAIQTSQPQSHH